MRIPEVNRLVTYWSREAQSDGRPSPTATPEESRQFFEEMKGMR